MRDDAEVETRTQSSIFCDQIQVSSRNTHLLLCTEYYAKIWVLKDEQDIVLTNRM